MPETNETSAAQDEPLRPSDSYVQSFARGLEVLRSFGAEAPSQTLSECAERVGLTRAGARRILLTLQTLGYVEQDSYEIYFKAAFENIVNFAAGTPTNILNPEALKT